jgi:hypothetical protein
MSLLFRVYGGFGVKDLGFSGVLSLRINRLYGFIWGLGSSETYDLGFRAWGSGYTQGLRFRAQDLGFTVSGFLGLRV